MRLPLYYLISKLVWHLISFFVLICTQCLHGLQDKMEQVDLLLVPLLLSSIQYNGVVVPNSGAQSKSTFFILVIFYFSKTTGDWYLKNGRISQLNQTRNKQPMYLVDVWANRPARLTRSTYVKASPQKCSEPQASANKSIEAYMLTVQGTRLFSRPRDVQNRCKIPSIGAVASLTTCVSSGGSGTLKSPSNRLQSTMFVTMLVQISQP